MHTALRFTALIGACLAAAVNPLAVAETTTPPGHAETTKTRVLEAGAALLQTNAPVSAMNVYLDGFHPMKDAPDQQMEAHHFCSQVNEDFAQCVLFDGDTPQANLVGIEYIVSEKLYETLPAKERRYWHPHNYEILSGQLVAPRLPNVAEKELMKGKINSYGKTWHVWNTGTHGHPGDKLPLGEPRLAWSFNHDGEAQPGLVEERDRRMGIDSQEARRVRAELADLTHTQSGVDALKGRLSRSAAEKQKAENQ